MTREEFEQLVDDEFPNAIPEKFRAHIKNVAFLVEEEPSPELRKQEELGEHETLLGFYHGIPTPMRGDWYGMGTTMPDTITLFQNPIESEAEELTSIAQREVPGIASFQQEITRARQDLRFADMVRKVIRETIWHEVAHHFGMDEHEVGRREDERDTI